jgi:hypothetical protein
MGIFQDIFHTKDIYSGAIKRVATFNIAGDVIISCLKNYKLKPQTAQKKIDTRCWMLDWHDRFPPWERGIKGVVIQSIIIVILQESSSM